MLDSVFLNLTRGNRLSQYMGLRLREGTLPKYGQPNYSYVEIPIAEVQKEGEVVESALRNQHLLIVPDCILNVRGDYHVLVEPNPALAEFGQVQAPYYIHSGEGEQAPGFYITLRKDLDLSSIKYAVRLYLQA